MTQDPRPLPTAADGHVDKLELHARQQLSALVDGELSPDEARFLLRRLQHDAELSGSFERWQLCGDVLRGQVRRAVANDFSLRVAAAIAAEPAAQTRQTASGGRRLAIGRWGGGAALAASVAAVAMLVGRPGAPDPASTPDAAVAMQAQALPTTEAVLAAPVPATAVASAPRAEVPRAAATRPARPVAVPRVQRESVGPALAASAAQPAEAGAPSAIAQRAPVFIAQVAEPAAVVPAPSATDPFATAAPLQARPWPRASLAGPASGYTASFEERPATGAFYPFEPSPPATPVAPEGATVDDLPAAPDDGTR